MTKEEFAIKIMKAVAEYDIHDDIFWNPALNFYVRCNDVFHWGCADCVPVDENTLSDLVKAIQDSDTIDGPILYCARQRKLRPQGAVYKHIQEKYHNLFDSCGPKRKVGTGNPLGHPKDLMP
jgi:hypothetical protein